MSIREQLEERVGERFKDRRGNLFSLYLKPNLSQAELDEFGRRLPGVLPSDIRELLLFASGISFQTIGEIDFVPNEIFGLEEMFPCGLPIAADDEGNRWVIDIRADTGSWGPVIFMSHDPPVAVVQASGIAEFIEQVLDTGRPDRTDMLNYVTHEALDNIWTADPYLVDAKVAQKSSDPMLSGFAMHLPEAFRVADLRAADVGSGFSWGRAGANSEIRRCGSELVFGVESKRSFLSRLRG